MREIKHPVESSSSIGTIIGMIVLISSQSILALRLWDQRGVFYASLTTALISLVALLVALYRTFFKKPTELCLSDDKITLNGNIINARDIKVIMTRGYFKPVIGILPYRRKIVPMDMAFRYSKDEDKGISELKNWAKINNVKMVNKSFQTWI